MGFPRSIWIGFDPREAAAFAVAKYSIRQFDRYVPIQGVVLSDLQKRGIHTRPMRQTYNTEGKPQLIDELSVRDDYNGAISTQHANARFLVPYLRDVWCHGWHAGGWALFVDCDVMFLANPEELFEMADSSKALMCVKHDFEPDETVKMDGQLQTRYPFKNSSSVMLFNCDHPANRSLTLDICNSWPGRDLHAFKWLLPDLIGEIPPEWNYLVGVSRLPEGVSPKVVHFTRGLPDMAGYENQEYADEWRELVPRAVGALN